MVCLNGALGGCWRRRTLSCEGLQSQLRGTFYLVAFVLPNHNRKCQHPPSMASISTLVDYLKSGFRQEGAVRRVYSGSEDAVD